MTRKRLAVREERPLDVLGIDEPQEQVYRWVLAHPAAAVQEVADGLRLTARRAQRLLDAIEAKGLVTYSPQRPRRYIPAPPSIAMEALVLKRQDELLRAQRAIQKLQEQAAPKHVVPEQSVEVLTSVDSVRQAFEQMQATARHEIISLIRPPMLISRLDVPHKEDQVTQERASRRGVQYRGIVDADFLAAPGGVERIRGDSRLGESYRSVPSLPLKMIIADRRMALVPMSVQVNDGPSSLLVRSSALLDALCALFELLWERAAPLYFTDEDELAAHEQDRLARDEFGELLSLMAAGLPDKAIAHELDISGSTFSRRLVDIMRRFGARTRFQLGWVAAQRVARGGGSKR